MSSQLLRGSRMLHLQNAKAGREARPWQLFVVKVN
jgi:hypothetical protein